MQQGSKGQQAYDTWEEVQSSNSVNEPAFFLLMLAKCGVARQRLSFTILTFENDIIELQMASVLHHVASASGGCIHDVASDTRKNTNNGFSFFCSKSFSKSIVHQYFSKYFPQNRFSISLFQNRFFAE